MSDPRNTPYTRLPCGCLYNPHGFLEEECFQCEHEAQAAALDTTAKKTEGEQT